MSGRAFGAMLEAELRTRRTSQSRFALEIGVDHSYVSRLIAGQRNPSPQMALRIIEALGIVMDETAAARLLVVGLIPERYQPVILDGLTEHRKDADELWGVMSETLAAQWQRRREAA